MVTPASFVWLLCAAACLTHRNAVSFFHNLLCAITFVNPGSPASYCSPAARLLLLNNRWWYCCPQPEELPHSYTTSYSSCTTTMADKWEAYYSKHFLPWDSGAPSSQLIAFLTSCLDQPLPAASTSSTKSISQLQSVHELVRQAEAAPLALPPEATAACLHQPLPQLHTCEHCAAVKPPAGGRVLELGCGTGASAVWLAKQVSSSQGPSQPQVSRRRLQLQVLAAVVEA
jgi:hypothetical protein